MQETTPPLTCATGGEEWRGGPVAKNCIVERFCFTSASLKNCICDAPPNTVREVTVHL